MGGGARSAYGVATGTLFPLGRRALASILTRTNPQLAQRIFRPRGGFVPVSPITSTYGTKIGPQPAPVKLPTPPPITAAKVAPRTPAVPAPATNLYEQLLKSRGFGISSMGQVGRPLGGKRSLMRAPFMKRFDSGGIFRQGTVPKEVYAMRRALRDIGLEEELARIADPTNPQSQVARREVLEQLSLVDETFERIMRGGKKIPKKTVVEKAVGHQNLKHFQLLIFQHSQ